MILPDADAPICPSGKHPFRGEAEALKELATTRFRRSAQHNGYRPDSVEERAYECPVCHWWHFTSSTGKRRRSELGNRGRRRR